MLKGHFPDVGELHTIRKGIEPFTYGPKQQLSEERHLTIPVNTFVEAKFCKDGVITFPNLLHVGMLYFLYYFGFITLPIAGCLVDGGGVVISRKQLF
jgi:hypothetical protein